MTKPELYKLLEFPEALIVQLNEYEEKRSKEIPTELREKLFCRDTWDQAIKDLQIFLGDDSYHINILWEQINFICEYSYAQYIKKGIPKKIFIDTFKFITRFISGTKDSDGKYTFKLAWWLQRQITMQEYRIGALEYEFVESNNKREIEIHIPSDADMNIKALCQSVVDFIQFEHQYMPDWKTVEITTETWMIMPELEIFLPKESKILQFKKLFDIDKVDYEQTWYMEWIFPGYSEINENLPEKTTLHRNLKNYLLSGKKFGIAKGHLVLDRIYAILK